MTGPRHSNAALLLLADGRLPAGGYAHSGGLEPLIQAGHVCNVADLAAFLAARADTVGLVAGAVAACACHHVSRQAFAELPALEAAFEARTPSSALRDISRTLGRQLLRTMSTIHPHAWFEALPAVRHQPVIMGAAAATLDLTPRDAALAIIYETVSVSAAAAPKLMAIDPFDVHRILADLTPRFDQLADQACEYTTTAPAQLPAAGAPMIDIAAEHHRESVVRLFAS